MMHRSRFCCALAAATLLILARGSAVFADEPPPDSQTADSPRLTEKAGFIRPNLTHPEIDAPFTLVDAGGTIRSFLHPARGVRLGRYVNHKVRVRGEETSGDNAWRDFRVVEVTSPEVPDEVPAEPQRRFNPPVEAEPRRFNPQFDLVGPVRLANYNGDPPPVADEVIPAPIPEQGGTVPWDARCVPGPTGPLSPQPVFDDEYGGYPDQGGMGDIEGYDDGGPACTQCGGCGHGSCSRCCHGYCGPAGCIWVRGEYLYWFTEGMHVPPLVTTGPSLSQPGYIGSPGTTILFGGNQVDGAGRSGGRITFGTWLDSCHKVGLEAYFFGLGTANAGYSALSFGNPILSRPFFDTRPTLGNENVELVAAPGELIGQVTASTYTRFQGAGACAIFNLCCGSRCYSNSCLPCLNGPGGSRLDLLLGYRYLNLRDGVSVNENLYSVNPNLPGTFSIFDSFTTQNQFHGFEIGTRAVAYRGAWSLELLSTLSLGVNIQNASVNGSTTTTQNGTSTTYPGGLLALSSNIGNYKQNQFAVVPELGANLGYQLTPRLRALVGYTFLYWTGVARAGDQIDTSVNSTLLPNSPTGPAGDTRHPMFVWQDTNFWAQGISAGLDYRW